MSFSAAKVMLDLVNAKVREDAGPNKDKKGMIARINKLVGAASNAPYCASTVSYAFRAVAPLFDKVEGLQTFPYTASSQAIKRSFKAKGWLSEDAQDLLHWKGAVGGWTNVGDAWHGHVFLVYRRLTTRDASGSLRVVAIDTIEANTNAAGSSEGSGVYILRRKLFEDGLWYPVDAKGEKAGAGHKLWFCNTTYTKGGCYWN